MVEFKITPPVELVDGPWSTKHVVELTIPKFVKGSKQVYSSPIFRLPHKHDHLDARIVLYDASKDMSAYIQLLPQYHDIVHDIGKFKFYFRDSCGDARSTAFRTMARCNHGSLGWGTSDVMSRIYVSGQPYYKKTPISDFLINGDLAIFCEIWLYKSGQIHLFDSQNPPNQMSKDIGLILSKEESSDISFKVGDKELKAHKLILSARCPVFNRMFESDMAETKLGTVEITDMEFDVLQSVLKYIYTDQVDNMDTMAEEMLVAADKYQLDDLKTRCEEALAKSLTVENAARVFILADLHRAGQLRVQTIHYINCHKEKVGETEGMKLAKEQHPQALLKAFL